jgi:hypothetical protein
VARLHFFGESATGALNALQKFCPLVIPALLVNYLEGSMVSLRRAVARAVSATQLTGVMMSSPAWLALPIVASAACSSSADGVADAAAGSSAATGGASGSATNSAAGSGAAAGNAVASGGSGGGVATTGGVSNAAGSGGAGGSSDGATAGVGGAGTGGAVNVNDTVTRTASTYEFRHFAIETNAEGVWSGGATPTGQPIETTYDTVILENAFLRVTLLPSYGGRVLSIVHKPTNRELLYQNPIGTPYLMTQSIFYYDYLVIMGGIFPSFPEPEHGRYWNQPYDLEVVSETPDAITMRMSRKDDRDVTAGVPARYDVGRTDMLVQLEVTLRAGSAALELATKLTNTRTTAVPSFEYWTVTTLAPGSKPGESAIPLETRILAKMDEIHLFDKDWPWFTSAETNVSGEVYQFDNLASFKNWTREGTAFASPQYSANWSGLANDVNGTNVLCVSDNVKTPGLKLWTFGKDSVTSDVSKPDVWLRPAIEMWHGATPEFWKRGSLAAGEVRAWTDRYFATLGLPNITAASENGAMFLSSAASGSDTILNVAASLTRPSQTFKAILRLNDNVVAERDVVAAAADATKVSATVPTSMIATGAVFEAEFLAGGQSVLEGRLTLN